MAQEYQGSGGTAAERLRAAMQRLEQEEAEGADDEDTQLLHRLCDGRKKLRGLLNGAQATPDSRGQSAERASEVPLFEWEDLRSIEEHGLGLRHVSTEADMEREVSGGFDGDALAMHNVGQLVDSSSVPAAVRTACERMQADHPSLSMLGGGVPAAERQALSARFQDAIHSFIGKSLDWGVLGDLRTVRDAVEVLRGGHSFLLVSRDDASARDIEQYVGLGKMGGRRFSSSDIVGSISASEIVDALALRDRELEQPLTDAFWERVSQTILTLIIGRIRGMQG